MFGYAKEKSANRVASERLIGKMKSSWIRESFIVSPGSQRVAYVVLLGDKWFVVVDGKEGQQYDGLVRGGRIIFDSADRLHYLARKGDDIYLVEERIQ